MKDIVNHAECSEKFLISSAAATTEELGNDIYPNAKAELRKHKIPFERRRARQIKRSEYSDWDYIIAMDKENLADIAYIMGSDLEHKVKLLMSFTGENRSVSDPWYTRDFSVAYNDIYLGCAALFRELQNNTLAQKNTVYRIQQ